MKVFSNCKLSNIDSLLYSLKPTCSLTSSHRVNEDTAFLYYVNNYEVNIFSRDR